MENKKHKNILLVGVNSKFVHVNSAVRGIAEYCRARGVCVGVREFTVNNGIDYAASEIVREKPDTVGFSCYIWNIEFVLRVIGILRKVMPDSAIVAGGPEVSYGFDSGLVDHVISGEGERAFYELVSGRKGEPPDMDGLPFAYSGGFAGLGQRILYYETSRGCPGKCGYCLSSADSRGVRFMGLGKVFAELGIFLESKVKQVKLVDRTFNCDPGRAYGIWKFLIHNDNGVTNFHFEIAADLLDVDSIELLGKARKGLFQFEIGLQSVNPETLDTVRRKTDLKKLFENIAELKSRGNIHIHLDLIAGLPHEDYGSFAGSFNAAYGARPDRLQLGFLKLLKGTELQEKAGEYGIVHDDFPPYEFLYTRDLPFGHKMKLKHIESVLEIFYNSGKFKNTLDHVLEYWDAPFDFYEDLAEYWVANEYHGSLHGDRELFAILHGFLGGRDEFTADLLKLDLCLSDNIKNLPDWAGGEASVISLRRCAKLAGGQEGFPPRLYNAVRFGYDILKMERKPACILFDYTSRPVTFTDITEVFADG